MKRKNILFLFSDQHRGDWMPYDPEAARSLGMDSLPLRMPNIRSLMDRGTTFTRAATNSPLCVPARACLALGEDYERCGAWNNRFCCPLDRPTFYSVLRDGGYQVWGVGKFDLHKPVMYWGEDGWIPQLGTLGFTWALENEGKGDAVWAFQHGSPGPYGAFLQRGGLLEEYCRDHLRRSQDPCDSRPVELPPSAYADNWVTENALAALHRLTGEDSPWFLMVNFSGPHDPWDVTVPMKRAWENTPFPIPREYSGSRDALLGVRQNYAAMLENIDRNIGLLIEELKRSGQLEDTVILYSADHGEMLGDRNRYFKSQPYRPSVQIPLVISGPGVLQNHICGELAQLNDLAATIAAFAGLEMPGDADSRSLAALAAREDAPPVREYQYSALYTDLPAPEENRAEYAAFARYCKPSSGGRQGGDAQKAVPEFRKNTSWRSIISKEYKYIEFLETGRDELYDLQRDPGERHNIADVRPDLVPRFRELLAAKTC